MYYAHSKMRGNRGARTRPQQQKAGHRAKREEHSTPHSSTFTLFESYGTSHTILPHELQPDNFPAASKMTSSSARSFFSVKVARALPTYFSTPVQKQHKRR